MDPFSELIALLRPHAALAKPISARGDWGVRYAAHGQPGFALVLTGGCWLTLAGQAPLRLETGDFLLLPATPAFEMTSRPGARCIPGIPADHPVHYGDEDGPADFRMLGGSFAIEPANAPLLIALLPATIHVRAADRGRDALTRIVTLLINECADPRPGQEAMLERLLEAMLIAALRGEAAQSSAIDTGLLRGLGDPAIARALRALHAEVARRWSVADLAAIACLSRSAFAARFLETVGCAPIEYLARWRMALARDALSRGDGPLDRLAERVGFESASAFSTAFRRRHGCPPRDFARAAA